MPILPNGDVIPSFLSVGTAATFNDGLNFDNFALRKGEVQKIVYPNSPDSRSKKLIEYNVLVQQSSNGTGNGKLYKSCILMNGFAGLADKSYFTLRADKNANKDKNGLGKGSKVLILCANGETNVAYIIGGTVDQSDKFDKDIDKKGHHLYYTFNGIQLSINNDGELILTYGGKTAIDGKLDSSVDSNAVGSTVQLLKNGNIQVADINGKNALLIDHENSKVTISRDTAFELGAATDHMLLGESFRNAQKTMDNQLVSLLNTLQSLIQTAGAQLTAASAPLAIPIVGGTLASPLVAAAAAALVSAAPIIQQLGQTINTFEQQASAKNSFLSDKNKAD